MRKLGVFVVLLVFLSASQVMAAPNLIGEWSGKGVLATPFPGPSPIPVPGPFPGPSPRPSPEPSPGTVTMKITISYQQEAPGGAVFRGTLYNPYPLPVTGAISLTNEIHMTVSDGFEAIAVLSGQYLGRAINVVLQDLTDQGVTGAFSLKLGEQQIEDDGQDDVQDQPEQKPGPEEEEDRPAESAPAQQPAPAPQR